MMREKAFTLLEIMVALALFGMIVTAIYSSWMAIMRGSKAGMRAAAAAQRARVTMHTIEESLVSVRSFAADIQYYGFMAENGSDASLSFVSRLSQEFPRSGKFEGSPVRRVTFSLEKGPDLGQQLVLRQQPLLMDLSTEADWAKDEKEHPVVLAKDVKEFKIQFWDGRSPDWLDEWDQTNQLPKMVKITLQFGPNDYSARVRDEVVRIISLPSITVQPAWQSLIRGGAPPAIGAPPQIIRPAAP
jgi:type II secretion system protein J